MKAQFRLLFTKLNGEIVEVITSTDECFIDIIIENQAQFFSKYKKQVKQKSKWVTLNEVITSEVYGEQSWHKLMK